MNVRTPSVMTVTSGGLVVIGEGEQLVVLDVRKKLLENNPLCATDKPPAKTLLTTVLPFCPTKVVSNPACLSHVLAVGGKQCAVCILSARAEMACLILVAAGEEGVIDAFWLPHSKAVVCVVTRSGLRFFHHLTDPTVPILSVTTADGVPVTNATLAAPPLLPPPLSLEASAQMVLSVFLVGSNGALYHTALDADVLHGPAARRDDSSSNTLCTAAKLPALHENFEGVNITGVHWSERCQIMCASYEDGRLVFARLQHEQGAQLPAMDQVCIVPRQDSLEGPVEVLGELGGWGNFVLMWPASDGTSWGVLSIENDAVKISRMPSTMGKVAGYIHMYVLYVYMYIYICHI
jgi:hypothetical protein